MASQAEKEEYSYSKDWQEKRKMGRIKYGLIYGSLFGFLMIFISFFEIVVDDGFSAISSEVALSILKRRWIFLPGGILLFSTLMWWGNNRHFRIKKKKS